MKNEQRVIILKNKIDQLNAISPTFCLAKWLQSTTTLYNGMTHSCHHPVQHKINVEDIKSRPYALHNTPVKIAARQDMLNGVQTKECDYCWNIENLSKDHFSDRHYKSANEGMGIWQNFQKVVDSKLGENIAPTYLEVAFENICNFKCSYCSPDVSSRWMEEIQQHGPYLLDDGHFQHDLNWLKSSGRFPIHHKEQNQYIDAFWEWWPELYNSLDTFRITGGEPLLSENTWKILDYVAEKPRQDFKISINTNMGVPQKLVEKLCNKINLFHDKIREIIIFTSAESTEEQAEYSRYGMDWKLFESNIDYFLSNTPSSVRLCFMTTVNILSVSSLHKFLKVISGLRKKWNSTRAINRIGFNIAYLRWPAHQCLINLDDDTKKFFENTLLQCIDDLKPDDNSIESLYLEEIDQIHRLINFMNSKQADQQEQRNFVTFFNEYDLRRGTNFLKTFPELECFYTGIK